MAAPKGAVYAPKSGPLAGQVFAGQAGTSQAYNAYQRARASALGFSSYREERQVRAANRALFTAERRATRFGPAGKLPGAERTRLMGILGQFKGQDLRNRAFGGPLDRYLQALGRRVGNEFWHPGETPDMGTR